MQRGLWAYLMRGHRLGSGITSEHIASYQHTTTKICICRSARLYIMGSEKGWVEICVDRTTIFTLTKLYRLGFRFYVQLLTKNRTERVESEQK